jgi:hypothetical protein
MLSECKYREELEVREQAEAPQVFAVEAALLDSGGPRILDASDREGR